LLHKAHQAYRQASSLLWQNPSARASFIWDGGVVKLTLKGFPDHDSRKLADWLRQAVTGLCDAQNQTAAIPRRNGRLSLNPEHWGVWPACDRSLWAWRQLVRMASMIDHVSVFILASNSICMLPLVSHFATTSANARRTV
jgi:hypothetical protein